MRDETSDLILRSRALARRLEGCARASWFETREDALLTVRVFYTRQQIGKRQ
jgi:hypothetical protein